MAITAATTRSDFSGFLNPEMSAPIFDDARRMSVAQRLFRQVPLGSEGQAIPYVTTKPTANWVTEGSTKPATEGALGLVNLVPKKLAAIAVVSSEVVRANPGGYTSTMRESLAEAFAIAFDYAVFHDLGGDGTGSSPFDVALTDTTKTVEIGTATQANGGIHGDFVAAHTALVADGKKLTGWALGDQVEPLIYGATDTTGRPLYTELPTDDMSQAIARPGRLLNRPSYMGEGVDQSTTRGFGGDFTKGAWGVVGGISYRVSTEAAVTINGSLVSLFENNLVAVLAEAEYAFNLVGHAHFVKLLDAV